MAICDCTSTGRINKQALALVQQLAERTRTPLTSEIVNMHRPMIAADTEPWTGGLPKLFDLRLRPSGTLLGRRQT